MKATVKASKAMITDLPDYRPPIEKSLRCVCGRRFVVYLGAPFPFYDRVGFAKNLLKKYSC
jgi:hypothetical protein